MENFCQLSFGKLIFHSENITEVVVDAGIEITTDEIAEYHRALVKRHKLRPFAVIVNRINDYSYSFEALLMIGNLENLKAVAMVYYSPIGKPSMETIQDIKKSKFKMELFSDFESGLAWAESQLEDN